MKKKIDGFYLGFCDYSITVPNSEYVHHSVVLVKDDDGVYNPIAVGLHFASALRLVFGLKGGFVSATVELFKDNHGKDILVMVDLDNLKRKVD